MSYTHTMAGFGDAALDQYNAQVAARNAALAQQAAQDAQYQDDLRNYAQTKSQIDAAYSSLLPGYNAALAAWQTKNSQYQSLVTQRNSILMAQSAATASVVRATGVNPPTGYTGCVNASDKAAYQQTCNGKSVVVRGVDGLGWARVTGFPSFFGVGLGAATAPECAWAQLPTCVPLPPVPPNPGPAPAAPVKAAYPPVPVPPTPIAIPVDPGAAPAPSVQPKAIAVGGILAIVLVGGGALYYLSTRKKKAA
jgi:hypothetical protein